MKLNPKNLATCKMLGIFPPPLPILMKASMEEIMDLYEGEKLAEVISLLTKNVSKVN
jgi:hypothetical protein